MTRILAIDCGTISGAAGGSSSAAPTLHTWRGSSLDGPEEFGARFDRFEEWLGDLVAIHQPELIAFEAPLVARGPNVATNHATLRFLFGLAAIVEKRAHQLGVACEEVNVQSVKLHFAGHGHAKKFEIAEKCRSIGWEPANEHEADAAAVWFCAQVAADNLWIPVGR